jgi:threonyl-tRNA synthetase
VARKIPDPANPDPPDPQRSHRHLGEALDLFHFPDHSPGAACWHPRGLYIYRRLEGLIRNLYERNGYQEVRSPLVCRNRLWERSGHLAKFEAKMLTVSGSGRPSALKPMNCPGHADLYAQRPRSYRELPLRIAELGHVHRAERSGELNGLLRASSFVIDDAHIFCSQEQVEEEIADCLALALQLYGLFNLTARAELSLRPEQRLGSDWQWGRAESALRGALAEVEVDYEERPGEGAFYGPKIDLHVRDALGREWQMGSCQLDFQLPERFALDYTDAHGDTQRPVIVHRAAMGSLERFLAILLEHYEGRLPLWLAPEVLRILPVGSEQQPAATALANELRSSLVRASIDADGPLGGRVRAAHQARVPLIAIYGDREVRGARVTLRSRAGERSISRHEITRALANQVRIPQL